MRLPKLERSQIVPKSPIFPRIRVEEPSKIAKTEFTNTRTSIPIDSSSIGERWPAPPPQIRR